MGKKVNISISVADDSEPIAVAVEQLEGELKVYFLENLYDCTKFDRDKAKIVDNSTTLNISYTRNT